MKITKLLALLLTVLALAAGCGDDNNNSNSGGGGAPAPSGPTPAEGPQNVTITIPSGAAGLTTQAFGTNPMVVPMGSTVTWVNGDNINHTSTSMTGVWDSGVIAPGASFSHTFTSTGTFNYHCTIHPNMRGTIQVSNATPTPTPTATSSPQATPTPTPTPTSTATPSGSNNPGGMSGGMSGGGTGY